MGNSACGGNIGDCCIPSKQKVGDYPRVVKLPDGGNGLLCCMESQTQSREWTSTKQMPDTNFFFDDTGSYETALTYESHREKLGNYSALALEQDPPPPSACNPQTFQHITDPSALQYTAIRAMPHGSNPTSAAAASTKPKEPMVSRRRQALCSSHREPPVRPADIGP